MVAKIEIFDVAPPLRRQVGTLNVAVGYVQCNQVPEMLHLFMT